MSNPPNLRDYLTRYLPSWLSDNYPASPSFGYRLLWTIALFVDAQIEMALQGSVAAAARGTPTALDYIGQARGLIRNQGESDEEYGKRLSTWVDRAKENGSPRRLAKAIHDYLSSHPKLRIFTRNGQCYTIDTDGTETLEDTPEWDWDSISNPERNDPDNPWWSDMWIVVYVTTQWANRPGTLGAMTGEDGHALGHLATPREIDAIKGLIATCKAAHERVRAVIWTTDATRFTPGDSASMPNGKWGTWSLNVAGVQVPSDRVLTTCRYWEPR